MKTDLWRVCKVEQHVWVQSWNLPASLQHPLHVFKLSAGTLTQCKSTFVAKRKEAFVPPTPLRLHPLQWGTMVPISLTLTPHYSALAIRPQALVMPVSPKTQCTNITYFISKWWRAFIKLKLMDMSRPDETILFC